MIVIVMGISGSGKTTIGRLLAAELGWIFDEGDEAHPPENVRKMAAGIPLTDADRLPWLQALRHLIDSRLAAGKDAVLACSALKQSYREILAGGHEHEHEEVRFVHLTGDPALIAERLEHRRGHFMKVGMLASQLAVIEPPEEGISVEVDAAPAEIVAEIRRRLGV